MHFVYFRVIFITITNHAVYLYLFLEKGFVFRQFCRYYYYITVGYDGHDPAPYTST